MGRRKLEPGEERPIYERVVVAYERACSCGCGRTFRVPVGSDRGVGRRDRRYFDNTCRERATRARRAG